KEVTFTVKTNSLAGFYSDAKGEVALTDSGKSKTYKFSNGGEEGTSGQEVGEGISIEGLEEFYYYTGSPIKPAIKVVDNEAGKTLAETTDYTVRYYNNKKVGTASISVKGKGNYDKESAGATFEIKDPLSEVSDMQALAGKVKNIEKIAPMAYTGEPVYPETITVNLNEGGSVVFKSNGDGSYSNDDSKELVIVVSNNVKKGSATVAVTGTDGKTKKATFKITAIDISAGIADGSPIEGTIADTAEYRVAGARPDIELTFNGEELIEGQDYTVKANAKKGEYTIKGKGNFAKSFKGTYTVTPLDLASCTFEGADVYEGVKADKVKATVIDPDNGIIPRSKYTVTATPEEGGADAKGKLIAGKTVTVKVTAKDAASLSGETAEQTFTVGTKLSGAKINAKKIVKTYTGQPIELEDEDWASIDVKIKKVKLVYGEDFVVAGYSKNVNKGQMIVTIRGTGTTTERGTFSGTATFKVKIKAKTLMK
nr:hypothetical protein [Lachnospiraceae bacterium]